MAFITVSGETGCRTEELAGAIAHNLHSRVADELGGPVPDKAWAAAVTSIVARLGAEHDLIIAATGSEQLLPKVVGVLRVNVIARRASRSGNLMLDHRTDRAHAVALLREL